ncbi:MAG: hypothetical protein FJZ90_08835 [Chloroflexi bacterium]|nr:hypothetical protein [Chloroflexota bacterium]
MSKHKKTLELIETARAILAEHNPMTVRQVYYQLVSRQVIENTRTAYQAVSNALVDARKEGVIPWEWIEDRLRRPRAVGMWAGLADFAETAERAYRRDVWATQPGYIEVWLEKDALSGIFEDLLRPYGVTLNVGRGYDGWDSIHNAAERYDNGQGITVLYFGDFDPSGEDMVRSLRERLAFFDCVPVIVKCALTLDDVTRYNLPPDFTKPTDTRQAAFVAKYGDMAVELDALPVDVLQERIRKEVAARMDMTALAEVQRLERRERAELVKALNDLKA